VRGASCIIVEGPDGAGKTMLAEQLATHYGLRYRRPPPATLSSTHGPQDGLVEWWDTQLAQTPSELASVVYDRCFYISDPIYQQAQAKRDLLVDSQDLAAGIMKLWNVEPFLIFCLPPFATQLANVQREGRHRLAEVDAQGLLKICNQYWAHYALWATSLYDNVRKYDYTEEDEWSRLIDHLDAT